MVVMKWAVFCYSPKDFAGELYRSGEKPEVFQKMSLEILKLFPPPRLNLSTQR